MQVAVALDFRRGPYMQLLAKHADVEDTRAVRQPWSEWHQLLVVIALRFFYFVFMSLDKFYVAPPTPTAKLVDTAFLLFPHLTNSSARVLISPHTVEGRPDIKSFGYDLGGSTCACTLQWDKYQYWQRVMYGTKYVSAHVFTVFIGVLILQRWQWVILYKVLNEVLEELMMPIRGRWAYADHIEDMETRYDSLLNDLCLAVVPFVLLGCHFVYVIDLQDPFPDILTCEIKSAKRVVLAFSQYYLVNTYNGIWNKFDGHVIEVFGIGIEIGKVFALSVQFMLLYIIWMLRALPYPKYKQCVLCLSLIWIPFTFYSPVKQPNEQISAILAFALAGIATSIYHYYYTSKNIHVLALMCPVYIMSFVLYASFSYLLYPPADRFYYKRKWCGLGYGGKEDSCSRIRY